MQLMDAIHKTNGDRLTVWTIYREPSDYPGRWVLRGHDIFPSRGIRRHKFCFTAATLREIRTKVPPGTWCVGREPTDHPTIHESWVGGAPFSNWATHWAVGLDDRECCVRPRLVCSPLH